MLEELGMFGTHLHIVQTLIFLQIVQTRIFLMFLLVQTKFPHTVQGQEQDVLPWVHAGRAGNVWYTSKYSSNSNFPNVSFSPN